MALPLIQIARVLVSFDHVSRDNNCSRYLATGLAEIVSDFSITHQTIAFVSLGKRQQGTKTRRSSEV